MAFDESNSCYLRFGPHTIALEYVSSQHSLYIFTSFSDLVIDPQKNIFEQLLTCNHFGQGSGNGWFSYNPDTQEILLMTRLSTESLEYDGFVFHLEAFLKGIERAKEFIHTLNVRNESFVHPKMHLKNPFA